MRPACANLALAALLAFRSVVAEVSDGFCASGACQEDDGQAWVQLRAAPKKASGPSNTERVHEVIMPKDTIVSAKGKTWCLYSKLPEDATFHTIGFDWTESKLPNFQMGMMFTISDDGVEKLKSIGYDLSVPLDCDDGAPLVAAQFAGGYLMYQQAPGKGLECEEMPEDWGMLTGKDTARRHILLRMTYGAGEVDAADPGAGFSIHLTTKLRPVSFGEAKFASSQDGATTITIPPQKPSWTHMTTCQTQGATDVFRGGGMEVMMVKPFGRYMYKGRLLESKGGGAFSEPNYADYKSCRFPHYSNLLLEDGDGAWDVIVDVDTPLANSGGEWTDLGYTFNITPGNSYRVECIYNTTDFTEPVVSGMGSDQTSCQFHMYYKEIAGVNEPFPGFCMDTAPWFMRTPNISETTASEMMEEWWKDPAHQQYPYGCPCPYA